MRYVMIEKIAEEIAYDNGCINAAQSKEKIIDRLYLFIDDYDITFLSSVEAFLSTLDRDEFQKLATGTQEEMEAFDAEFADLYAYNTSELNDFLDTLFDEAM